MDNLQQSFDQRSLQDLLGTQPDVNLIPESLVNILTISLIVTSVLMLVLTVLFIIGSVRRWKVQSAVLKMQKDVADIKQALAAPAASSPQPSKHDEQRKVEIADA